MKERSNDPSHRELVHLTSNDALGTNLQYGEAYCVVSAAGLSPCAFLTELNHDFILLVRHIKRILQNKTTFIIQFSNRKLILFAVSHFSLVNKQCDTMLDVAILKLRKTTIMCILM